MRLGGYQYKLKPRVSLSNGQAFGISVLAIVIALLLFSLIFILAGINPLHAYQEIFSYSFVNQFGLPLTINRLIFLLLATYAFIVPFRAGLWNIGMTGQFYAGSLAAYGLLYLFSVNEFDATYPPAIILIPLMLVAAALGGAAMGGIAGFLKGRYNVNEIVVTMMLNFMSFWFVSFMIKDGGPFMNAGGRGESFELPDALKAPLIGDIPFTVFIAIGAGLLLYYMFAKTKIGYEIRAYGKSPAAAEYAGISKAKIPLLVFLIGGALAGLAGYHLFAATPGVYKIARNYGLFGDLAFYGIICGLISQGNPLASIPVAFLFGGLSIGGRFVQGKLGMSFGVDFALLGVLMITLVAFQFFYRYQIVRIKIKEESLDGGVFIRSLDASTIFTIAALGELIGQRSGVINVGVEGVMLFGATLGFIAAQSTGNYLIGFVIAVAIGALLGLLHGFFSITLGGDQVVSGMGIWILGFGLTTYIGSPYTGPLGMERIPTIFGLSPFFFVGIALVVITWFVLFKTSLGLKIRSVGENPSVAEVSGINISRIRYLCVVCGGMLMGFAGAIYALDYNPVWSYNFVVGWGFIALALVFFSMWNPLILLGGSLLFGTLWQLSLNPQLVLPGIMSRYIWRMVPFVITVGVLLMMTTRWFRTRWGAAKPEALGQPYIKEG